MRIMRIMFPRLNKARTILGSVLLVYLIYYFGIFTHVFERDFYSEFDYPLAGDNIIDYARQIRRGQKPDVAPINVYNYSYIIKSNKKCIDSDDRLLRPRLVIVVKSALNHFDRRIAIRQSWGYEKRFSDVTIRTVFILGVPGIVDRVLQDRISAESEKYQDIVQADFHDTYFNNTIKTMTGLRWSVSYCPRAKFYLFADDDFLVSIKNILRFIRNPVNYPVYLEEADEVMRKVARRLSSTRKISNRTYDVLLENGIPVTSVSSRQKRHLFEYELSDDARLFAGYVFKSAPHRHRSSKWYISLEEYPWHMWPTYVTAGSFILSREALHDMYYTSMFTKHFRFDDIFLGLVAMKAHIEPLHSDEFYFHKATYSGPSSYKYLLASHGYADSKEMLRVWNAVRSAGHA